MEVTRIVTDRTEFLIDRDVATEGEVLEFLSRIGHRLVRMEECELIEDRAGNRTVTVRTVTDRTVTERTVR